MSEVKESVLELQLSAVLSDPPADVSERELVERAKRDRDAFAELYRQHYAVIARYIFRRVGDRHVTEDLVAETFLTALRALPKYRYRSVPIRAWFYRLAASSVNRWVRRRRFVHQRLQDGHALEPEADESAVNRNGVRQALLSVAPRYQTVLTLHHLEGLSVREVARTIGCRTGTVKSRLSRGRLALREELKRRRLQP